MTKVKKVSCCSDLTTLLLSAEPAQTETNVVVIVIQACDFLLAEKVRDANDEGSSWKSAAKYLLLKNACDNVDFRRTNETNPKLTGTKYNRVNYYCITSGFFTVNKKK
jgi:hypothetical protein